MAWARGSTNPKYQTREHRAERARWAQRLKRDGVVYCAQPVCVMPSRAILEGQGWHLGHADNGVDYIGPTHVDCNVKDAAVRARAKQLGTTTPRRWVL
jgi:hypothetical protein